MYYLWFLATREQERKKMIENIAQKKSIEK